MGAGCLLERVDIVHRNINLLSGNHLEELVGACDKIFTLSDVAVEHWAQ